MRVILLISLLVVGLARAEENPLYDLQVIKCFSQKNICDHIARDKQDIVYGVYELFPHPRDTWTRKSDTDESKITPVSDEGIVSGTAQLQVKVNGEPPKTIIYHTKISIFGEPSNKDLEYQPYLSGGTVLASVSSEKKGFTEIQLIPKDWSNYTEVLLKYPDGLLPENASTELKSNPLIIIQDLYRRCRKHETGISDLKKVFAVEYSFKLRAILITAIFNDLDIPILDSLQVIQESAKEPNVEIRKAIALALFCVDRPLTEKESTSIRTINQSFARAESNDVYLNKLFVLRGLRSGLYKEILKP